MTDDDDEDESDKHLEARDRRYSCLIYTFVLTPYLVSYEYSIDVSLVDKFITSLNVGTN